MTMKNIIHRAQCAGVLALLSFVAYATVFAKHGSSRTLSFLRLS
jgi:hypothetical protein